MTPIGYFFLPLELRQKILHDALEDAVDQDMALNVNFRLLEDVVENRYNKKKLGHPSIPHLHACAMTLIHTHPTIINDIPFVLEQHLKVLEEDWARSFDWTKASTAHSK